MLFVMKRFVLFVTAILIAACTDIYVDTETAVVADGEYALNVSIEGGDTRVQLNEAGKTVWNSGDRVAVMYRSTAFEEWQFKGNDGDRTGVIAPISSSKVPTLVTGTVAVYPYGEYSYNSTTKNLTTTLGAEQCYLDGSYGENGNMLVAYSTNSNLVFKNIYGWLKLQLTGENQSVKSITVKGNNYESLVGDANVNVSTLVASLTSGGEPSVKLNCGDEGAALSDKATSFYIGLLPQTFEKGISVEIETTDGDKMTKSTSKKVVIERNTIQPMATFEFAEDVFFPTNNELWYFGYPTTLSSTSPFEGVNVVKHDERQYCADMTCMMYYAIVCDGEITKINSQAFAKNDDITSIYIPHSVTTIGASAFYGCGSMTEVYIGEGIKDIGVGAFANCVKLESLYLYTATPPTLGDLALVQDSNGTQKYIGCTIYVPKDAVETYKSHSSWSKYKDYIKPFDYVANEEVEEDDSASFGFNHRLLLVDHTGVNCAYCPGMTDRLLALSNSEYADYYYDVQVHGGSYASGDPAYSYAASIVDRYYRPSGYPALMLNFVSGAINNKDSNSSDFVNNTMAGVFNSTRKKFGADAGIAISATMNSSTITIDANVKSDKTQEYRITAWVLENNISSPNQNGATQDYHKVYNHALRYIAGTYSKDDISGDSLGVIEKGSVADKHYTVNIDSAWNYLNLEVLVIVSAKNVDGEFEVVNCAMCPMNAMRDYEYIAVNNDEKEVVLSVSPKRIKANGEEKAIFSVKYGDDDVTANAQIYNTATNELLSDNSFYTATVGTYQFTARYNGYSAVSTVSVEAYLPEPAATPEVGAIYEVNGVKGVIYAIKNNWCYMFSLDEEDLQWSTEYVWCNCASDKGDWNTYDPFDARYSRADGGVRDINNYPAFKWCMDHGSDWYLPSSTELNWIWDAITEGAHDFNVPSVAEWNKIITDNGGEPFCETFYWSSNETSADLVEAIAFMANSVVCLNPAKDSKYTARAVYRFKVD